jgi:hypothetical protein
MERKEIDASELDQWLGEGARMNIQEAHNCGDWLESRLHLNFTEIADNLFGDGLLSREERIALSGAIGNALDAFRGVVEEKCPGLYQRSRWANPDEATDIEESGELTMFVPLVEKAMRRDGTIAVKLIQPGWGSSGYYPAEVLERDGPGIFTTGTHMFWNHQTHAEEAERPEGDLNDLAAVLVSDARWQTNGVAGPGLYADAKVFEAYRDAVNELAPHIGVSIRAQGRAVPGEMEGRKGLIVQGITSAKSSDFVTKPGAGGQILEMFEAARQGHVPVTPAKDLEMSKELEQRLEEAATRIAQLEAQNARLTEAGLLREARDFVAAQLVTSTLPDVTQTRLLTALAANPPVAENGTLDREIYTTRIQEAIQAETVYLQQVTGYGSGRIRTMGDAQVAPDTAQKRLNESFQRLGLNEREVKHAVSGRTF